MAESLELNLFWPVFDPERRGAERLDASWRATVWSPTTGEFEDSRTLNLSRRGIALISDRMHRRGERLSIDVQLPTGPIAKLRGLVKTMATQGTTFVIGIEFDRREPLFEAAVLALEEQQQACSQPRF